jgi:serine protease
MPRRLSFTLALSAAIALTAVPAAGAASPPYRPREVIVQYAPQTPLTARAAIQRATDTVQPQPSAARTRLLRIRDGRSVAATVRDLRRQAGVEYAVPNYIAHAAGFIPNDPGRSGTPGGWQQMQWNFLPDVGVDAPDAWVNVALAGAPGGRGVTVAVLDTGVAFENHGRFRRSPDFLARTFVRGYDFVDRDRFADDQNGHGTFVSGLIAEATNNHRALTGLAYGARIMPVRVLDSTGDGDAATIARGIRFAAQRGAKVINLSLEFDLSVHGRQIPSVLSAIRYATRRGALVVGASGNEGDRTIAYPARSSDVVAVGATTEHLCQADYSNEGVGLDIVAPGGGGDMPIADDPVDCHPLAGAGRNIFQLTYSGSVRRFGYPRDYMGTSMAAPHVSAAAALVIASGVIGRNPSPQAVERHLEATARDLGPRGYDERYGYGLLDAAAATSRSKAQAQPTPAQTSGGQSAR